MFVFAYCNKEGGHQIKMDIHKLFFMTTDLVYDEFMVYYCCFWQVNKTNGLSCLLHV